MDMQSSVQQSTDHIVTPIKKNRSQFRSQLKTAQSPDPIHPTTITDIDPHELFQKFHQIVNVTEVDEQLHPPSALHRKIYFQTQTNLRLNFDESSASMRKKNPPKKQRIREEWEIEPFMLLSECGREVEEVRVERRQRKDREEMRTPRSRPRGRGDLGLAARKEDPFRDLSNQK